MNVSRTPLQEALVRLEKEGLVESIPRRGTFIKKFSSAEMVEIYELREVLEVYAVKSAVPKFSEKVLVALDESCGAFERAIASNNIHTCLENNVQFHQLVVRASENNKLAQIIHTFYLQTHSIQLRGPNYLDHAPRYLKDHREILRALRARDADRAAELVGLHIRNGKDLLLSMMNGTNLPVDEMQEGDDLSLSVGRERL